MWITAVQEKWPYPQWQADSPMQRGVANSSWMPPISIVNLFAPLQYQHKGEAVSPLSFLQAARTGVVISCQTWNRFCIS
jgi:hypothetical protein